MTYLTRKLEGYLKHAQTSFGADMKTVHDTTTAATKKEKGLGLLTALLEKKQFADFHAGVAPFRQVSHVSLMKVSLISTGDT